MAITEISTPVMTPDPNDLQNESDIDVTSDNVTGFNKNRVRRTRAYRKLEKKYSRVRNLAIIFCLLLLAGTVLSITSLKRVSLENLQLTNDLAQANHRIEMFTAEMQSLRVDNDTLVQGRIPGLIPLKFDEPFKLDNTLKNIIFTRTSHNGLLSYEYLAVLQNNSTEVLRPASLLLFFDRIGVEIGRSQIAISQTFGDRVEMLALQPGESHSFSGTIHLTDKTVEPTFFKLVEQK